MPVAQSNNVADDISSPTILDNLSETLAPHFQQAQHSVSNHRKNIVSLHRLHLSCSKVTLETAKGTKLVGEKAFNDVFFACLNRVLGIKKGVLNADRCIKFVGSYAKYTQEQFRLLDRKARGIMGKEQQHDDDEEPDTPATRFVTILLKHLLRGFVAKNKNVRLRTCQAIALLINGLESVDDVVYRTLKLSLLERARDKESHVRVHAIIALAKLQAGEDEDATEELDPDDDSTVTAVLLDALRHDPSAEVRRAALFNLTPTPITLPYILERLRDVDAINRRCVYLGSMAMLQQSGGRLSVDEATEVVTLGLGEREASVRKAARVLIGSWLEADKEDLVQFLSRFDIITPTSRTAAQTCLEDLFEVRPSLLDAVDLSTDEFWAELSPPSALVARAYVAACQKSSKVSRLDSSMPLVTALAFRIQASYNQLLDDIEIASGASLPSTKHVRAQAHRKVEASKIIVESLLKLAFASDYGDEIGRRKMFGLVREMISHQLLPEDLIAICVDVLGKLSSGERDFVRVIVEIVQESEELDDDIEDGEQTLSVRTREKTDVARRLVVVRSLLETISGALQDNTAIHGLIPQLIAPAVRSKDERVREEGLLCLGLCCLIDRTLALDTFPLFLDQIQRAAGPIKHRCIQLLFDLLLSQGFEHLCARALESGSQTLVEAKRQITDFLLGLLEDDEMRVQAIVAEGMVKLLLSGMVDEASGGDNILRSLVLVYMSPETASNAEMRQCLSFAIPAYAYSSAANQRTLRRILLPCLDVLTEVYYEKEESQSMATPQQIGLQLVDWCDPEKAIYPGPRDEEIHLDVAIDIIRGLIAKEEKEDRRMLTQLLSKLYLGSPEDVSEEKLRVLFIMCDMLKRANPIEETATRNGFARFEAALAKRYPEISEAWDDRDLDATSGPLFEARSFLDQAGVTESRIVSASPRLAAKRTVSRNRHARSRSLEDEEGNNDDDASDDFQDAVERG